MKKLSLILLSMLLCLSAQESSRLSNDTTALADPAHILSTVVLQVGDQFSKSQIEEQILQLNRILDHKKTAGYQPIRLRLDQYEALSLDHLNKFIKRQCVEEETISEEMLKSGSFTFLRSLRYFEHPSALMIYVLPYAVDENFREQSTEPLTSRTNPDEALPLGAVEPPYENDYLLVASNMTLARSFGKFFTLSDAWEQDANVGQSLEDIVKNGSWEKGTVDKRSDRDNAMDVASGPYYFTLSQLKCLYQAFLDRQNEDRPIKEEKGPAFSLDAEDLHALGKRYMGYEEYEKALKYFQQASQAGNPKSDYAIAYLHDNDLIENASPEIAIKYYQKSAEKGLVEAQFRLGLIYEFGLRNMKPNIETAQKYWKMAAAQGHAESKDKLEFYQGMTPIAANQVKSYYSKGMHAYYEGDYLTAVKSFYSSAVHKHKESIYFLGLCYFEGKGVPKNILKAKELWDSISSESEQAQFGLGLVYFYGGDGIEQDLEASYDWFSKASDKGHTGAKDMLKQFEQKKE
ncbi:MAG: hypothetical protein AABZ60_19915 [Planctomycetota bacterium]